MTSLRNNHHVEHRPDCDRIKGENLRFRILLPLVLALALILGAFVFGIYKLQRQEIYSQIDNHLEVFGELLTRELNEETVDLSSLIDVLQQDEDLQAAWLQKDRPAVRSKLTPLFKQLESKKQITQLFEIVKNEINTITEPSLKKLLNLFFKDPEFIQNYKHSPSAISHHHNYVGGNLQHTVGVIKLCNTILDSYPTGINHDLLITGALLHDVGKLKEYKYEAAIEKTAIGNFIGHIVIGDRWIREKINELRQNGEEFPEELETHLLHLILSHHGRYEWGSPKIPKTVEACTLHYADLMDSQVKNYQQNLEEAKKMTEEDWAMVFDSELGKRRLVYLGDIEQKL